MTKKQKQTAANSVVNPAANFAAIQTSCAVAPHAVAPHAGAQRVGAQEEQAPPTKLELAVAKAELRLEDVKHISASDLGVQYIFPILRKIAKEIGDHDESLEDLGDAIEQAIQSGGFDDDSVSEVLVAARDTIVKLGGLLDQVMVASGFYSVVPNQGLKAEKVPAQIRTEYEAIIGETTEVVMEIQNVLQDLEAADDGADEDLTQARDAIVNITNLDAESASVGAPVVGAPGTVTESSQQPGGNNGGSNDAQI